jgi:hypothetical protein
MGLAHVHTATDIGDHLRVRALVKGCEFCMWWKRCCVPHRLDVYIVSRVGIVGNTWRLTKLSRLTRYLNMMYASNIFRYIYEKYNPNRGR